MKIDQDLVKIIEFDPVLFQFIHLLLFTVSFWCSIRVAVAFVGFLGMVAHYSQKINVGIALVCMVNHSEIASSSSTTLSVNSTSITQIDIDCPRADSSSETVTVKKEFIHLTLKMI